MSDTEPDMTAAELALGVLEGDERAAALRRVLAEPGFAAEVEQWRTHFGALFAQVPEVAPPPALFARIEAGLDGRPAPVRRSWLWPSVAGLSSVAAAALLALLVTQPPPPPARPTTAPPSFPAPLLAAAILPTAKGEPVSAVYDPGTGTLRLSAATLADPGHAAELWVIGSDAVPHSLGVLQPGQANALPVRLSNRPRLSPTAVLAVTVEPLGGSPTGGPTGPIVAKGTLSRT